MSQRQCTTVKTLKSLLAFAVHNLKTNHLVLLIFQQALYRKYNNAHAEKEARKEYINEYRVMDFMQSLPLRDDFKDQLYKYKLATKMDDIRDFVNAKDVLVNIIRDITNDTLTVTSTLRVVFVGAYSKVIERTNMKPSKSSHIEESPYKKRPVSFYNWLEERVIHKQ